MFAWVFVNQAGVPVPVVPSLVAAGALAANGDARISVTLLAAGAAALCADIVWYGVGRWRGARVLGLLRRISHAPDTCADRAENLFLAHEVGFQFWARFLPELNAVVAGLAGATRVALGRYVVVAIASAIAWAGVWTIAGYLRCGVPPRVTVLLGAVTIGAVAFALVVVAVVAWVVIRSVRRNHARFSPIRPRIRVTRVGSSANLRDARGH